MTTYVIRDGKLVLKSLAAQLRSADAAPNIIRDYLPDLRHTIDGKVYDSKSKFRQTTRAHGCVEVGNEVQRDTRRLDHFDSATRKSDIAQAIRELGG